VNTGTAVKNYLKSIGKKFPKNLIEPSTSEDVTESMTRLISEFYTLTDSMDKNVTEDVLTSIAAIRWSIEEMEFHLGAKTAKQNEKWNNLMELKNGSV
jgi:hypothetical protein